MSSPIHVHVQDNTPLHVHVKKPKKTEFKESQPARSSNARHSVRSGPRGKLKPINDPWIPAPGKTSIRDRLDKQYKWESTRSQLEVNAPQHLDLNLHPSDEIPMKASDLSTEEDSRLRAHLSEYERKIENLMSEVGTLKNEVRNYEAMILQNRQSRLHISPTTGISDLCYGDKNTKSGEKQHFKLNHVRCFKPIKEKNPVDERVNRALSNLLQASYKKEDMSVKKLVKPLPVIKEHCENSYKPPGQISDLIGPTSSKSDPLVFLESSHRTDFEKKGKLPDSDFKHSQSSRQLGQKVSFRSPLTDQLDSVINLNKSETSGVLSVDDWQRGSSTPQKQDKMELKKIEGELERKDEQLEASHAALEDKMKELNFIEQEFQETEKENMRLRKSVENYQDTMATSLKEVGNLPTDKDSLLHQLVEVEVNGTEAGKQVAALRDVASRLKYEKRLAISDVNLLSKQRDLLLQKLEQFEASNRKVRRLLQSQHKTISDVQRLEEQRDILMKKMADSDSEILKMRSELIQRRNDVEQLTAQVSEEKNHARTLNELNKSVEATRAHLQRELRAKEMENNRLHVQLKNMERDTEVARREAEEITAAARSEREMIAREKEGLKKATRSQRNRAEKAEDEMKRMEERLGDRERKLEEARSQADAWRDRYQRTADEKGRLDDHVQSLAQKASDLESVLRSNEIIAQTKEDEYRSKLDKLMSDNSGCRSDAERNKTDCALAEERSRQAQKEAANLRAEIRQRESVEADLRTQLRKAKNEAEEALLTAERVERNSRRMRDDGNNEIERVREQMLDRMRDLQPLPELLKETEMKLQDTQDKLHVFEQRSAEQTRIIAELTNKTEDRADETSSLRQRIVALNDENRALEARLQILQVKLDDRDVRVKETVLDTVGKDERIQQLQLKFEEANHEKVSFKRQLEAAVADSRKAVESEVEKAAAREHAAQARIIDLETTITRLKTDVASAKRSKEDSERRNQSKLQDAKDRLEQAESTNRSMRNYVNFLKTSYNNVFGGDASFTSTPVRGADRSPF